MGMNENDFLNEIVDGKEGNGNRVTKDLSNEEEVQKVRNELQVITAKYENLEKEHEKCPR